MAIDLLDHVIEPEGYGFNLNSSMKFEESRLTSPSRVNPQYRGKMKISEAALALTTNAVFDEKRRHCFSRFAAMVAARTVAVTSIDLKAGRSGMQSFETDVHNRVTALVEAILAHNASPTELGPDAKLVDAGLTSMDMVSLMLSVEAEFDFTIPQNEITPENFQSVEALRRMVVAQLQPTAV